MVRVPVVTSLGPDAWTEVPCISLWVLSLSEVFGWSSSPQWGEIFVPSATLKGHETNEWFNRSLGGWRCPPNLCRPSLRSNCSRRVSTGTQEFKTRHVYPWCGWQNSGHETVKFWVEEKWYWFVSIYIYTLHFHLVHGIETFRVWRLFYRLSGGKRKLTLTPLTPCSL